MRMTWIKVETARYTQAKTFTEPHYAAAWANSLQNLKSVEVHIEGNKLDNAAIEALLEGTSSD